MHYKNILCALLITNIVLLVSLIPGGPIETRTFATLSPTVIYSFNTFLTLLVCGSCLVLGGLYTNRYWAKVSSIGIGLAFVIIFALDLLHIFPVSEDSMPPVLFIIEVMSLFVGISLSGFSIAAIMHHEPVDNKRKFSSKKIRWFLLFSILFSLPIIYFASKAALGFF